MIDFSSSSAALVVALGIACVGVVTSTIYAGLVAVAADRFHRRRERAEDRKETITPAVSVLKPLHGAEPGLRENLESFFQQRYDGPHELLFCARHAEDAGLGIARDLARQYPHVRTRLLTCGEPEFPNPKMYSIAVMAQAAEADLLLTSDADARVSPDYLERVVQEMQDPNLDLTFSLYCAHADTSEFYLHMDVLGKSVEMNAGVLVADMLEGTNFSLGVTVLQRNDVFARVGGCAELGSYWAEDFVLGNRLAKQGRGVRISPEVVQLVVTASSAAHSFQNQLRWMQSTRRSRPLGHLGTGLTFAMPFALLGAAVAVMRGNAGVALLFLLAGWANRALLSASVLRALGAAHVLRESLLYPVRDVYGFVLWLCSYLPADTRYHGTQFRIMPDGRLLRPEQN